MGYLEMVKADVTEWMDEGAGRYECCFMNEHENADDFGEWLYDFLWTNDEITGNGSGSYTFNREASKEYVLEDIDTVREALVEFCTPAEEIAKRFLEEDWEYFDVTARCYVLGQAISEYIEEHREQIEARIKEAKEESEEEA